MVANRRDYPRHVKRLRSRFRELPDGEWNSCFTYDISVSGIFFQSSKIPRTDKLEVEVELDGKPVTMVAKVVRGTRVPAALIRTAKGGFAVRLLEATPVWYEHLLALAR
jgi:hypothetical protein